MLSDPFICRQCGEPFLREAMGSRYCTPCGGAACALDGCNSPRRKGAYCELHYRRILKTGEPGTVAKTVMIRRGEPCTVDGCQRKGVASGMCDYHYHQIKRYGRIRTAKPVRQKRDGVHSKGYRYIRHNGRQVVEQRVVMERVLGRPLRAHENVHHRDGDKLNNDPPNLELWVKTQPCGQRATDKVRAAIRLLKDYPELATREGYRLVALESAEACDLLNDLTFSLIARQDADASRGMI